MDTFIIDKAGVEQQVGWEMGAYVQPSIDSYCQHAW